MRFLIKISSMLLKIITHNRRYVTCVFINTAPDRSYQAVGCFKDNHIPSKRPLPTLLGNHRDSIDWQNINKTVDECSHDAWNDGFPVFGIQFYGECWSGRLGYESYSVDGVSTSGCWEGVGGSGANYVYAFDRE